MAIVGHHPETGVRVVVERSSATAPWRYVGEAATQAGHFNLVATVDGEGRVDVDLPVDAPPALAGKVRLIVRAAYKHALAETTAPPRRIARWRADR